MAYVSGEMRKVLDLGGNVGGSIFAYDTVDALATIYAIGYVSDAWAKGMRKGDIIYVRRWTTAIPVADSEVLSAAGVANVLVGVTQHVVLGISTAGAADLTDGQAIAVTNT